MATLLESASHKHAEILAYLLGISGSGSRSVAQGLREWILPHVTALQKEADENCETWQYVHLSSAFHLLVGSIAPCCYVRNVQDAK